VQWLNSNHDWIFGGRGKVKKSTGGKGLKTNGTVAVRSSSPLGSATPCKGVLQREMEFGEQEWPRIKRTKGKKLSSNAPSCNVELHQMLKRNARGSSQTLVRASTQASVINNESSQIIWVRNEGPPLFDCPQLKCQHGLSTRSNTQTANLSCVQSLLQPKWLYAAEKKR